MFHLEIWPDVPTDFNYLISVQLLNNREKLQWQQFVRFPTFQWIATIQHLSFPPRVWRQGELAPVWIWSVVKCSGAVGEQLNSRKGGVPARLGEQSVSKRWTKKEYTTSGLLSQIRQISGAHLQVYIWLCVEEKVKKWHTGHRKCQFNLHSSLRSRQP